MKKKLLALLLTVAMMVTFLPFSALVSAETTTETETNDGIAGIYHSVISDGGREYVGGWYASGGKNNGGIYSYNNSSGAQGLYIVRENGEAFYKAPHTTHATTGEYIKTTGTYFYNDYSGGYYGADDVTTMEFDNSAYLAIRMKVYDYSETINYDYGLIRLALGDSYYEINESMNKTNPVLWFDVTDGSVTKMYQNYTGSAYNGFAMIGDMDGYMLVPLVAFNVKNTTKDAADVLKVATSNVRIQYQHNTSTTAKKKHSWDNRDLYVGNILILNDKDKFVSNVIAEKGITKYESGYDDGAYMLQRIPGYRNFMGTSGTTGNMYVSSSTGYANADPFTAGTNYRLHFVTLPGGDQAISIGANNANTVNMFTTMIDTYDDCNVDDTVNSYINNKGTKLPSTIATSAYENYGMAVRIATTGNEGKTSHFRFAALSKIDTFGFYQNDANKEVTFIDYKTGAVSKITTLTGGYIALTGDVDGWIIIPSFGPSYWNCGTRVDLKTILGIGVELYKGHWNKENRLLFGNTYLLTDIDKFIDAHNDKPDSFHAASLTLQDDLTINLKVNKARYEDLYGGVPTSATVSLGGGQTATVTPVLKNGQYVFTVKDIAPDKMGADLNATLNIDDETGTPLTYSVADYCYNKLSETEDATFKTLLVDILNYGSAAQTYKNYSTDALVNAKLTTEQAALATGNITLSTENRNPAFRVHANPSVGWKSANLYFKENVSLRFKFEKAGYAAEDVKIAVSTTAPAEGELMASNVTYYGVKYIESDAFVAEYDAIGADDMRTPVYVTVCDADGNAISDTLVYSVEAYAASKQNSTNTALADLVVNMMKYGDASAAYRASMEG